MPPRLSLVICTLDESESIGHVLREVDGRLAAVPAEIIVVDDSADDRTGAAVRAFVARHCQVTLIHREDARGLASAAMAGWAVARGEILGLMDGDGQHDPAAVVRLLASLDTSDADIAVASRYAPGAHTGLSGFRHRLSRSGTWLAKRITRVGTSDPLSGCFLFRRTWWNDAAPRMSPIGYKVLLDLALSGPRTPKVTEVATALRTRLGGQSKLDARVMFDLAAQLVEKRTQGLITARFVLFSAVGAAGVFVNLAVLMAVSALGAAFWLAQMAAVLVAMTGNFALNNLLTFRDRRLTGAALWRGLMAFYVACASGAFLNELVALTLHAMTCPPLLSALGGAIAAAVWNYASVSKVTWTTPASESSAAAQARLMGFKRPGTLP